jgi:NAD-reducing hydrogenase large subunit
MKFPYLKTIGPEKGWMRVGPLARINSCDFIPTPKAQRELEVFRSQNGRYSHKALHYHWARLIEMLFCTERIGELLRDPWLQGEELVDRGEHTEEGIGFIEAPRGTLIHHYRVDPSGEIKGCNLIVSTTHNNQAMNESVAEVAQRFLSGQPKITEGLLNHIEVSIRAYDPCLSCATHALGKMPLKIELHQGGRLVDELTR